jgi:hypothetical protein
MIYRVYFDGRVDTKIDNTLPWADGRVGGKKNRRINIYTTTLCHIPKDSILRTEYAEKYRGKRMIREVLRERKDRGHSS